MPRLTDEEKLQKAKETQARLERKLLDRAAAKEKREGRAKDREANKHRRIRAEAARLREMLADDTYRKGDTAVGNLAAALDEAFPDMSFE